MSVLECDIRRCHHIKTNGTRCGSPALRNHDFCHYHRQAYLDFPLRRIPATPPPIPKMNLGYMEDPDGIHYALTKIIYAIANGTIDHKAASLALYGLQTLSSNFKHTTFQRQLDDEYRASNLNAYQIWDKYAQRQEEIDKKELYEKRRAELAGMQHVCSNCHKQFEKNEPQFPLPEELAQNEPKDKPKKTPTLSSPTININACATEHPHSAPSAIFTFEDFQWPDGLDHSDGQMTRWPDHLSVPHSIPHSELQWRYRGRNSRVIKDLAHGAGDIPDLSLNISKTCVFKCREGAPSNVKNPRPFHSNKKTRLP